MAARLDLMRVARRRRGRAEMSAVANAYARFERPEPGGPVMSHECVIAASSMPARAARRSLGRRPEHRDGGVLPGQLVPHAHGSTLPSRRRQRHGASTARGVAHSEQRGDALTDARGDLVDRQRRVDDEEALGLGGGEREVGAARTRSWNSDASASSRS